MEPHNHLEYLGFMVELGVAGYAINRAITGLANVTGSTTLENIVNTTPKAVATSAVLAYPLVNLFEYFIR